MAASKTPLSRSKQLSIALGGYEAGVYLLEQLLADDSDDAVYQAQGEMLELFDHYRAPLATGWQFLTSLQRKRVLTLDERLIAKDEAIRKLTGDSAKEAIRWARGLESK